MTRIDMMYGVPRNYLELTESEYIVLDVFLQKCGVRSRIIESCMKDGIMYVRIEAENPYKIYSKKFADSLMTLKAIVQYKR